jgi:hypothetical protein
MAYWRLREALDPHTGDNLALPPDAELEADLKAPKWSADHRRHPDREQRRHSGADRALTRLG